MKQQKLIDAKGVARLLDMPIQLVRMAHNENSSSYRPMFPKPVKKGVGKRKQEVNLFSESEILAYKESVLANPVMGFTRAKFEKAKANEELQPMRYYWQGKASNEDMARMYLKTGLKYVSKWDLRRLLDEFD